MKIQKFNEELSNAVKLKRECERVFKLAWQDLDIIDFKIYDMLDHLTHGKSYDKVLKGHMNNYDTLFCRFSPSKSGFNLENYNKYFKTLLNILQKLNINFDVFSESWYIQIDKNNIQKFTDELRPLAEENEIKNDTKNFNL